MRNIFDELSKSPLVDSKAPKQDARELQAMLYREIGISAVAAALFMSNEMDRPADPAPTFARERLEAMPVMLRGHIAA